MPQVTPSLGKFASWLHLVRVPADRFLKMQYWLAVLILSALLPGRLPAQAAPDLAGTYRWTFSDREGRPSKCDCDYRLEEITLHADSTCIYLRQEGRLSPRFQQWERGTWELEGEYVRLRITEVRGGFPKLLDQKVDPETWRPEQGGRSFRLVGRHLEDGGRIYD
jgi:hypothetical protein